MQANAADKAVSADAVADAPRDSAEAASSLSRRRMATVRGWLAGNAGYRVLAGRWRREGGWVMLANMGVPSISVIIPAFNEAATIHRVIAQTVRVLRTLTNDYEVVVLDDGSTDGTWLALERARAECPAVRLLRNRTNMGIGQALMPLVRASRKELVFMLPGDGQIPPEELRRFLPLADRLQLINGVRSPRRDPAHRRFLGCAFNLIISALGGVWVRDVDSSTLYRGDLVRAFSVMSRGAFVHAELFLRAVRAGARVGEVHIAHRAREAGRPTGARVRVIAGAVKDLLRYMWTERREIEPPVTHSTIVQ